MKLTTRKGQLDLPGDFRMTMERINPMLSEEGDASVPITLPSSSRNLLALGHLERIDRADTYVNKVDAILTVGPVQKHGHLVIDTVRRHEGIDASFAIDSGDLYVKSRDKSLKELFASVTFNYGTVAAACAYMQDVYQGREPDSDFRVFPVAVSPYEEGEDDDKRTVYQYNNEVNSEGSLVSDHRMVREGDISMLVPEGYGIAPYLRLQRLLRHLFEQLGYIVEYNCFDEEPYSRIVIVHNCADCLVTPVLYYADLVPSCTLGEFMEWLLAKFHALPVVDSESRHVKIVMMESLLKESSATDTDISSIVEGDFEVMLNPSARVVLTPCNEIEGTEPAAATFDDLIEKYGGYVECDEAKFASLAGDNPDFCDCLLLRLASGEFFLLERDLVTGKQVLNRLGTNYFTYNRGNSDETEGFSQSDVMPLMLVGDRADRDVAPFIGARIHRHTSYNGEVDDSVQKIIAVQAAILATTILGTVIQLSHYATTGTTQKIIPYRLGAEFYSFRFGMDNYSLYDFFWADYNRLKLNHLVHLKGKVKYGIGQFLGMDMSKLVFCDGQRLLPVKSSMAIGEKTGLADAEFVLVKNYADGVADTPIAPMDAPTLKWDKVTPDPNYDIAYNFFSQNLANARTRFTDYKAFPNSLTKAWLGLPARLGETREITTESVYIIYYDYLVHTAHGFEWDPREKKVEGLSATYKFIACEA